MSDIATRLLPGEADPREPSCAYPGCGLPEFIHPQMSHPFREAEQRVWLVLNTGANVHALPVTLDRGAYTLAPGHYVSPTCGCEPVIEEHPLGGPRLVSHTEPSWPGASQGGRTHA